MSLRARGKLCAAATARVMRERRNSEARGRRADAASHAYHGMQAQRMCCAPNGGHALHVKRDGRASPSMACLSGRTRRMPSASASACAHLGSGSMACMASSAEEVIMRPGWREGAFRYALVTILRAKC